MEEFQTIIKKRDFSGDLAQAGYRLTPEAFTHHAIGGPKQASYLAQGPDEAAEELLDLLRCPVETYDRHGNIVWWGYVSEVMLSGLGYGLSLDNMVNRAAATFSQMDEVTDSVGERTTTAWVENADSVAEFGVKEQLLSIGQSTVQEAENKRDLVLERCSRPVPKFSMNGVLERGNGSSLATIKCKGWWHTTGWKLYGNPAGKEGYESFGRGVLHVGNGTTARVAQSFQLGSGWETNSARIRMSKAGNPQDTLQVALHRDNGGKPGELLTLGTLPGDKVPEHLNWVSAKFNGRAALQPYVPYWLVVSRSGSDDSKNYYKLDVNEELAYERGVLRVWNGTEWQARDPDGDLVFTVGGVTETSQQLADVLTTCGQFFTGVDMETSCGIWTSPFREGDQTGLAVAQELLKSGTANGRRLLATVDPARRVRIYEEPARNPESAMLMRKDRTVERLNAPIPGYLCPVGSWFRMKDLPALATGWLVDASMVFIEEVTWDARRSKLYPVARDVPSPFDLVR